MRIRLWNQPEAVLCDVADTTVIDDLLIGRHAPPLAAPDSVWFANQLCDLVQVSPATREPPSGCTCGNSRHVAVSSLRTGSPDAAKVVRTTSTHLDADRRLLS